MKNFNRKTVWLLALALVVILTIGWMTVYVLTGVSDAITINKPVLLSLRKVWLVDGSPESLPIKKYVARSSHPERFFVWTNEYVIDGQTYQSLFGMNDPRFEGKGILIVSKDGELIWVASRKPPKLLKPNQ